VIGFTTARVPVDKTWARLLKENNSTDATVQLFDEHKAPVNVTFHKFIMTSGSTMFKMMFDPNNDMDAHLGKDFRVLHDVDLKSFLVLLYA